MYKDTQKRKKKKTAEESKCIVLEHTCVKDFCTMLFLKNMQIFTINGKTNLCDPGEAGLTKNLLC